MDQIRKSDSICAVRPHENTIVLLRSPVGSEWDSVIGTIREQAITGLDAAGWMTDGALRGVSDLNDITDLRLNGCSQLTDEGLAHLGRMPQLERLDLSEYPGGKLTDRGLEVLRQLPTLRHFEMAWQAGISDAGASNLQFCDKLEQVSLMGTPTGDRTIAALGGKPRLWRLETGRMVTDLGLGLLRGVPAFERAHEGPARLLIDGPFTNNGFRNLTTLKGLKDLDLFWHTTGITPDAFAMLPAMDALTSLGCDGELSNDDAMKHIANIPGLRKLRAQGSTATDEGFEALSRSVTLEHFWGRDCPNFTGRGFAAFSKMPALRSLGISCARVDDAALSLLPSFPALRELTSIGISDDGFRHVGGCERLERLSCMYCRDTTDVATKYIERLRLKSYYAGLTQITDASLEMLGRMGSLEAIELYETKLVTNAGLARLSELPGLREVRLSGIPGVTMQGTRVFPGQVQVHYRP